MAPKLFDAIEKNDTEALINLVGTNKGMISQRDASHSTALHLATRFGHIELVKEIIKLCPQLVAAVNEKLETPLHEACRQGNDEISAQLLKTNLFVATLLNQDR